MFPAEFHQCIGLAAHCTAAKARQGNHSENSLQNLLYEAFCHLVCLQNWAIFNPPPSSFSVCHLKMALKSPLQLMPFVMHPSSCYCTSNNANDRYNGLKETVSGPSLFLDAPGLRGLGSVLAGLSLDPAVAGSGRLGECFGLEDPAPMDCRCCRMGTLGTLHSATPPKYTAVSGDSGDIMNRL